MEKISRNYKVVATLLILTFVFFSCVPSIEEPLVDAKTLRIPSIHLIPDTVYILEHREDRYYIEGVFDKVYVFTIGGHKMLKYGDELTHAPYCRCSKTY